METAESDVKIKGYKIAFIISSLYIAFMLTVGVFIGENIIYISKNIFDINNLKISSKYTVIVLLSSIFVFVMTCIVFKRMNQYRTTIEDNLSKIKEKEDDIEIAGQDIANQKTLIHNVLESASVFLIGLDENFHITRVSKNIKDIIHFEVDEIEYKPLSIILDSKHIQKIKSGIKDKESFSLELDIDSKYGKKIYTYATVKRTGKENGDDRSYTFVLCDISKRKSLQNQISYLDSYDSLTDLPNRNLMERVFTSIVPDISRNNNLAAFLYIDIDHFAFINETKGHHAGDHLLMDMAEKLKSAIKETDILGRITQDKFAIIITGEKSMEDIGRRINKIIKTTTIDWKFEDKKYIVSTTIGVSLYPKDGLDFVRLLKSANLALECAKESSRTSYEYYNAEKKCIVIKDLTIVSDIKTALKEGQFEMHYQPIYNLQTEEVDNVESLIRWKHPEKGYIPPDEFIPAAERSWIIGDIGEYTLEEAFRQKVEWNKQGYKLPRISVNISAINFSETKFAEYIEEKLIRHGLRGDEIVLELTESGFSTHEAKIQNNIEYLRNLGVRISMDDFGTGYSSLERLKDLKIDDIKLDRAFVVSLLEEDGQEIIKTLISLANALGKDVVSEGIETKEQYDILKELGSEYGQGYFLARPMSSSDVVNLFKKE